jgi:hypothetical protein
MIPTRIQIQAKVTELNRNYTDIATWLDSISCPDADKLKILDDLDSYE